jgi:drug/metabolite transporter superfamily protein YnfA
MAPWSGGRPDSPKARWNFTTLRYTQSTHCVRGAGPFQPTAAGRVYAAYGGVYIGMSMVWLWAVDGINPTLWDIVGSAVAPFATANMIEHARTQA